MPWNNKKGVWEIGSNELIPNESTHPCFPRDTHEVEKALDYMNRWNNRTYVECLRNALLTIQKYGSDVQWLEAESKLDKLREKIPFDLAVRAVDGGIPVAIDIEQHYILRKYDEKMSRNDQFELRHQDSLQPG